MSFVLTVKVFLANIPKLLYIKILAYQKPKQVKSELLNFGNHEGHKLKVAKKKFDLKHIDCKNEKPSINEIADVTFSARAQFFQGQGLDMFLSAFHAGSLEKHRIKNDLSYLMHFVPDIKLSDILPFKKKITFFKKSIILSSHFSDGYYHFVFHDLLKLFLLRKIYNDNIQIVSINKLKGWQLEWLDLLGFDEKNISYFFSENKILFKKLIFFKQISDYHYLPHQDIIKGLTNKISKNKYMNGQNTDKSYIDILYVSREKAKYRKISNESELISYLENSTKKIIKNVRLEDLALLEKIETFKRAKKVIGIHGAGLSHIIFMNKKSTVIELIPENINPESENINLKYQYEWLSKTFDLKYRSVFLTKKSHKALDRELYYLTKNDFKEIKSRL